MILGFKPQFVAPINSGVKIHSIREDKTDRWKEGNTIHFATGVRTKNYDNFKTDVCKSTQSIEIFFNENEVHKDLDRGIWVLVDNIVLSDFWVKELAYRDGFKSVHEFYCWFGKNADYFKGKIIHWTDFQYNNGI